MVNEKEYLVAKLLGIGHDFEDFLSFEKVYAYKPRLYKSLSEVKAKPIQPSAYHESIFNDYQNYLTDLFTLPCLDFFSILNDSTWVTTKHFWFIVEAATC